MLDELGDWRKSLNEGDEIVFEHSHYFLPFPTYFEDKVKEIVIDKKGKDVIKTEAGLVFTNGCYYKNGQNLRIENPKNDYLDEKDKNGSYNRYKYGSNITNYQSKLSLTLRQIWSKNEEKMISYIYHNDWENALIEDKYRDKDKINYFKTLSNCIGFEVKNNSLYKNDELFIKRCSKSIGKYKLFRQPLQGEEKEITKWQKSLIYIYNLENNEIRQEVNMCFYYAWHWLEREVESYNSKYERKYESLHIDDDFATILKTLNGGTL